MVGAAGHDARVTVIIPTYNWSTVLPFSIASVLEQSFADFELLVVGDGCTDDSADVVAGIPDPRVRWYNLPENVGSQAGPNNEGIRHARGEVIAYLGHDDVWLPDHLECLVGAIDEGASFAHARMLSVSPGRKPFRWPTPAWKYRPGAWIPPTTVAHPRALIDAAGGWRMPKDTGDLLVEEDLWSRMAAVGGPPSLVKRVTSVKLFAIRRPGVYRERPSHEQQYWLTQIRETSRPGGKQFVGERWSSVSVRELARGVRWRMGIRGRLEAHHLIPARTRLTAEERRLQERRIKGVDDPALPGSA